MLPYAGLRADTTFAQRHRANVGRSVTNRITETRSTAILLPLESAWDTPARPSRP